jgi:hypothetical protein
VIQSWRFPHLLENRCGKRHESTASGRLRAAGQAQDR